MLHFSQLVRKTTLASSTLRDIQTLGYPVGRRLIDEKEYCKSKLRLVG
jgi:hypothetical protein